MILLSAFKTFLFLLLVSKGSGLYCPEKCRCINSHVKCGGQFLRDVPKTPNTTTSLDLRNNQIAAIHSGTFQHNSVMTSLLVNDNHLSSLTNGCFMGLKNLRYLYLYNNRLRHISPLTFRDTPQLQVLYLQSNQIRVFDSFLFGGLKNLQRLYLNQNEITKVPAAAFDDLPKLHKLRLDGNPIECDCSIIWILHLFYLHKTLDVTGMCVSPEEAIGKPIASYDIEKMTECTMPKMIDYPEDTAVTSGDDVFMMCDVIGNPDPIIQWFRNFRSIPSNVTRYDVMSNGTMIIHQAQNEDVGFFECTARSPLGVIRSRPAKLIVNNENAPPKIITRPENVEAKLGQPFVFFHCEIIGQPRPRVFWMKNDVKMVLEDRTQMFRNGSIKIKNIKNDDAGFYTCIAENPNGRVTLSASLTLLSVPMFTKGPTDQVIPPGGNAELECEAIGVPPPIIEWFKDDECLVGRDNVFIDVVTNSLEISNATLDNSGFYLCRASNLLGVVEITGHLQVENITNRPVKIVVKPIDTEAYRGTTVQLPCESDSRIDISVEWRKDGTRITSTEHVFVTIIGSLVIKNLTLLDSGRYECSVSNEFGRDTVSAFLRVKDHQIAGDEFVHIALTQAVRDVDQAIENTMIDLFKNKISAGISRLFNILRYPNGPARQLARAAEIYDRVLDKIREYIQNGLNVTQLDPFNYLDVLTGEHLELIANLSGCTAHRIDKNCSDLCHHKKYRTIDGSCNNLKNPMWGASLTAFRRILLPLYENGFSHPIGWNKEKKYNGFKLPSAREVSLKVISTENISADSKITHMVMQWGQWLDHDLDHSLPSVSSQTWDGVDCKKTCDYAAPCFPMEVPIDDPRIKNRRCIDFVRTSSVCGSGMTSVLFGKLQPREQINQLTSFIDASQVYGFELSVADDLRDLTTQNGMLRVGPALPGQKPLLPFTGINGMDCRRNVEESSLSCFVAGDIRANEQIGLAAMHTLWMREHNRLALKLKELNPFWNGNKIYNEARKIVGAQVQHISYAHWLPLIVGPSGMDLLGPYKGYDKKIDPSVSNVFSTAALRFGHSLINPILQRLDENFDTIPAGDLLLRDAFFSPWRIVHEGGIDPLLRGMFISAAKLKKPNENLNTELTERLFESAHAVALDLAAINIQRGRDHAIPPYTKWRAVCNMTEVESFDDLKNEISDENIRNKLKKLYGSVDNIDVWVGGILEDQIEGGKVGPLFQCLLLEQFQQSRNGDRFWYENPTTFTEDQLDQIKQVTLARVLCDNGDNIDTIGENVFILPEEQDGLVSCEDVPSMDLRFWIDCEDCEEEENKNTRKRRDIKETEQNKRRIERLENEQDSLETAMTELAKKLKNLEYIFANN